MIPVDVSGLINDFGTPQTLSLERPPASSGVDAFGVPIVAAPTVLSRKMVVHQATRKLLESLDLDVSKDWRSFYAAEDLQVSDVVPVDGERWELHEIADYSTLGGIWLALGLRIE